MRLKSLWYFDLGKGVLSGHSSRLIPSDVTMLWIFHVNMMQSCFEAIDLCSC